MSYQELTVPPPNYHHLFPIFMLNKTKQVISIYHSQYSIACSHTAFTNDPGFDYFLKGG